jgi:hypothetical protein
MHVLQWIAVQDESKEDAHAHVRNNLEEYMGDGGAAWYDWFVAGGGRWNPNADNYNDNDFSMVISLEEEGIEVVKAKLDECIESRLSEFRQYQKSFAEREVDIFEKLDSYTGNIDYSFDLYPISKMIDMLQGNWDFNSYYFDMEAHSTNTQHMLDKIASGRVNWYLVPVDFHF